MAEVSHDGYNDDYNEFIEKLNINEENDSTSSFDSSKTTPQYHAQKAEMAMNNLKFVVKEPGWKKVLLHKSGTTVYSKPGITRDDQIPVFMGEHVIDGFTPRAIFAVIGMRKLWDDWYEEGKLVENLNDTTSLTYMVMQALAGSKARDLSLVEKIECAQDGTIYFIATSVETPKVPRVYNKIRANLNLNGWILEPLSYNPPRTKVTYVLQTKIKGWFPSILAKTYLARRPLVLHTIEQYLQKNGALPMVVNGTPPESARPSVSPSDISSAHQDNNNTQSFEVKYTRKKISFTNLHKVNPIQTTEEIQNGSLPHQDETIISPSSYSPPRTTSPLQPLSSTVHTEKSNLPHSSTSIKPVQHRHTVSLEGALKLFRSHIPLDDWNFHSENKGIKIYMKDSGRSTPIMRGDGVISGGFTTYDILSVIKNTKSWDDGFDDGATYEIFSLHEQLTRASMKGIFPISGRDFSTCGTLSHEEDTGILQFVVTSVVDPLIPEIKKYVRGSLNFVGWQLKPHLDVDGNTTSVDVVYITDVDIKLDTIPSSIRNMLSVQIPTNVAKVGGYIQKNGFPPYVLNSTAKIEKGFSDKNDHYELSLIAGEGDVTEFKISKLMFPNGVEVSTIPEDCKVEVLPNSPEIIRVNFPQRINLDILTIAIRRNTKGFRMTYNHGRTIPIASSIERPVEIIKKTISAPPKYFHHSANATTATTSTNATLVANETIDSRVINSINSEPDNVMGSEKNNKKIKILRKNRKSFKPSTGSRNIITSKIFTSPAEVPLKSDPVQRLLEKQTLLENKIAAITRDSRRDYSLSEVKPVTEAHQTLNNNLSLSEVKPVTEAHQTLNNNLSLSEVKEEFQVWNAPAEVKRPMTNYQESNTPVEVKQPMTYPVEVKQTLTAPLEDDDFQASNDDLFPLEEVKPKTDQPHDDLSPLEKDQTNKVNKDNSSTFNNLMVITESIRFNTQQIGLIFASMLLAYYAGKLSI